MWQCVWCNQMRSFLIVLIEIPLLAELKSCGLMHRKPSPALSLNCHYVSVVAAESQLVFCISDRALLRCIFHWTMSSKIKLCSFKWPNRQVQTFQIAETPKALMWLELWLKNFSTLTCLSSQRTTTRKRSFVPQPIHSGNYALANRHKQRLKDADMEQPQTQDNWAAQTRIRHKPIVITLINPENKRTSLFIGKLNKTELWLEYAKYISVTYCTWRNFPFIASNRVRVAGKGSQRNLQGKLILP